MKKTIIIFAGVIVGIYAILSLLDQNEYAIEKRLWRVNKQFREIAQDPKAVPDKQFEDVAARYGKLANKYPQSTLAPAMLLQIGRVYILKKDYVKAREAFETVAVKFPNNKDIAAAARLGIGTAYERQKDDIRAVKTYRQIIADYPRTEIGLNMPLYIANYYVQLGKQSAADQALLEAETYYRKLAGDKNDEELGFGAQRLLVTIYLAQSKWDAALNTLEAILFAYARSPYLNLNRAALLIDSINRVALGQLKDIDRAIGIYQKFIKQNPEHPLNKTLQGMIASFVKAKHGQTPALKSK